MIPLRDRNETRRRPVVTWSLIAINVALFAVSSLLDTKSQRLVVQSFGLVPGLITSGTLFEAAPALAVLTPLSSMFLHGGLAHLVGNMWFLHIFGDNVEDALGRGRFVLFYVLGGLAAAAAQVVVDPSSAIPMIGASGAISGVLGGYLVLFPRARVLVLVPIVVFVTFMEWPAYVVVGEWLVLQIVAGLFSLTEAARGGGVAWFAHIGGFLFGLLAVRTFARAPRDRPRRRGAAW